MKGYFIDITPIIEGPDNVQRQCGVVRYEVDSLALGGIFEAIYTAGPVVLHATGPNRSPRLYLKIQISNATAPQPQLMATYVEKNSIS